MVHASVIALLAGYALASTLAMDVMALPSACP